MTNILIVEDEERIATLVKRGLEEHRYHATFACDGASGKKLALSQDFDLIITDNLSRMRRPTGLML